MKRLLVLLLCVGVALPALAVQKPGQPPRFASTFALREDEDQDQGIHRTILLKKLTSGQPVRVAITVDDETKMEKYTQEVNEILPKIFEGWFSQVRNEINASGRAAEFVKMLEYVSHPVRLEFVDPGAKPDLKVHVYDSWEAIGQDCGRDALACANAWLTPNEMCIPSKELFVVKYRQEGLSTFHQTLTHEVGHLLGLTDQYALLSETPYVRSHLQARSSDLAEYGEKSVMGEALDVSPDDVDGLINAIDAMYGTEPARAQGWKGFAHPNDTYLNGLLVGASPYAMYTDDNENVHLVTYHNGKKVSDQTLEWTPATREVITSIPGGMPTASSDREELPVHIQKENGVEIYFSYNYDRTYKLVLQNGKVQTFALYFPWYTGAEEDWCSEQNPCASYQVGFFSQATRRYSVFKLTVSRLDKEVAIGYSEVEQGDEVYALSAVGYWKDQKLILKGQVQKYGRFVPDKSVQNSEQLYKLLLAWIDRETVFQISAPVKKAKTPRRKKSAPVKKAKTPQRKKSARAQRGQSGGKQFAR